jgi:hypothetical protein
MAMDCGAILFGFGLFSLIAFLPGYAMGWWLNVLRFRTRTLPFRLAASAPLALALGPILSYVLGRAFTLAAAELVYALLSIYALYLFARALRGVPRRLIAAGLAPFLALIAVWLVIALVSLADLQIGRRVYFSIIAFDYSVRTAFTSAIAASGIPPQNPFFFPGHPVGLRYHYFWLILCAVARQAGGPFLDSRQAFIAGTLWCGIALICLVPLYLRVFSPLGADGLRRRSLIGIALLGVTGLDILPALLMLWLSAKGWIGGISPSVEWWNNQVDGWIYTMLWEPHYLCSLVACLTGFLVVWDLPADASRRSRATAGIVAGAALASAVGAGIYVALVFGIFLCVWTLITIAKKWHRETAVLAVAGGVAIALSIPYLTSLTGTGSSGSGGQSLQLTVRAFDLGEIVLRVLRLDRPWQILLGDAVWLPLNYFLELGFFFAAGFLAWSRFRAQRTRLTRAGLAAFTMAATSVAICTFVKSTAHANNDLGWRGFLIAQFVLLLSAADLLAGEIPRDRKPLLRVLLVLGVAGVLYDLAILRFYPLLSDAGLVPKIEWLARDGQLGRRTYANREAYQWLRARTPLQAIIQQNPDPVYQDTFYGLYANRQTVAEDSNCGAGFGGDPRECGPVLARLTPLFAAGAGSGSFADTCQNLPIDILAAKDTDQAWQDRNSWVWTRTPIFANDFVRLFSCRALWPALSRSHTSSENAGAGPK